MVGVHLKNILWVTVSSALATVLSLILSQMGIGKEIGLMVYLIAVLSVTVLTQGYYYGIIASFFNLLMFNYFFTEPLHSFLMVHAQDYILIAFFSIASLITGTLSSKYQQQRAIAKKNEEIATLLYGISQSFLYVSDIHNILKKDSDTIKEHTRYACQASLNQHIGNLEGCTYSTSDYLESETPENNQSIFQINGISGNMGKLSILNHGTPLKEKEHMVIQAVLYQMGVVIDRELINLERAKIKISMESEHVKNTLLRSLSHDLRTPLTGIMGASSLIYESMDTLDTPSVKKLGQDIHEEASWLYYAVQNILDMTRIGEGKFSIQMEYEAVDDLIGQTINRTPWVLNSKRLKVEMPDDILMIKVDGRLIVQTLVNLLDNAYKHSGTDNEILLRAYTENESVCFEVEDFGKGIDPSIYNSLFEGFVTQPRPSADSRHGVGLGLAICKTIADSHGGRISAWNKPKGGCVFKVILPMEGEE